MAFNIHLSYLKVSIWSTQTATTVINRTGTELLTATQTALAYFNKEPRNRCVDRACSRTTAVTGTCDCVRSTTLHFAARMYNVLGSLVGYFNIPTLLALISVFLGAVYLLCRDRTRWPPGPRPLPFIGNALRLTNNRHMYKTFTELAAKYGEIFHMKMGPSYHWVVLNGHDIIREAFVDKGEYFNNRPNFMKIVKYFGDGKGRLNLYNPIVVLPCIGCPTAGAGVES